MWNEENVTRLTFSDAYIDDTEMYVSHNAYNGLFRIDRRNDEAFFVKYFEEEEKGRPLLHSRITKWKNSLLFFPYWANGISEYKIDSGIMEHYNLKNYFTVDILKSEESIMLFPCYLRQPVVRFYPDRKQIVIERTWTEILEHNVFSIHYRGFLRINQIGEKIYIGMSRTNILLVIDKNNIKNYIRKELDMKEDTIYDVFSDRVNKLWITTFKGTDIYEYDIKKDEISLISDHICISRDKRIFSQNENVFVIPEGKMNRNIGILDGKQVRLYTMIPEEQKIVEDFRSDFSISNGQIKYIDQNVNAFQCPVNQTQILLIENGRIGTKNILVNDRTLNINEVISANKTYTVPMTGNIREGGAVTLYSFLNNIKKRKISGKKEEKKSGYIIFKKCL